MTMATSASPPSVGASWNEPDQRWGWWGNKRIVRQQTKINGRHNLFDFMWFVSSCFAYHVGDSSMHQVMICYALHCCASIDLRIPGAYGNAEDYFDQGSDHQKIALTSHITNFSGRRRPPAFSRSFFWTHGSGWEEIAFSLSLWTNVEAWTSKKLQTCSPLKLVLPFIPHRCITLSIIFEHGLQYWTYSVHLHVWRCLVLYFSRLPYEQFSPSNFFSIILQELTPKVCR
jgi:hypothetical protein